MAASTVAALLRQHPGAAHLAVHDGRIVVGIVIDTRRPDRGAPRAPAYAFDPDGRFVGEFGCRREAAAALPKIER